MKLTLKLLRGSLVYEVPISTKVQMDTNAVIVRGGIEEVAIEPVKVGEHDAAVEYISPNDTKQHIAMSSLDDVRDDEIVQDIREYLGVRINDEIFNDIVAAVELYATKHLSRMGVSYIEQRVREIVYIAMFIVAGAGPTEAYDWFRRNHSNINISIPKYSRLANGIGDGARCIAELLWPHRLNMNTRGEKEHNWLTADDCQSIIDALLKGYSVNSIAKYFNAATQTIYNIRNGKHTLCSQVDYDGEYPISRVVEKGSKLPITTCRCCGTIIPVKRLLYIPGIKICVNCQDKEEKRN